MTTKQTLLTVCMHSEVLGPAISMQKVSGASRSRTEYAIHCSGIQGFIAGEVAQLDKHSK